MVWSFAAMAVAVSLVASCGDDGDEGARSTSTTSGTPSGSVVVERDIAYATAPGEGWLPAVLDVYAPGDAEDLPLVVLFHGGLANKDVLDYPELARAIAGGGAVVVVPNWGGDKLPHEKLAAGLTAAQIIDEVRQSSDEVACAVSYAVTHAEQYGADPTRLVLFGHSGSANKAGVIAWTETSAFAGCAVPPAEWTVQALMLWDGDWFMGYPAHDAFRTDLPALLARVSPWPALATATDVPPVKAEFAVSTTARGGALRHPDASSTAEWLTWRDPTGRLQDELEAVDAFADGFLDPGEASEVMVNVLNALGADASLVELTDPATTHEQLAEADFDLMVEHVLALAGT
jgi:hypothetical protein